MGPSEDKAGGNDKRDSGGGFGEPRGDLTRKKAGETEINRTAEDEGMR